MNGLIRGLNSRRNTPVSGPWALLVVCALFLLLPALYAQTTGALLGTVSDQSGAVVPGAKVMLQNESSGDLREVATNEVGRFTFAGVQPSTYTIQITSANFKTWRRTGFAMSAADTRDLSDIKLEIGSGNQVVTVEAAATQVDLVNSGERSAVITAKDIDNLTLVSRNVSELLKVLPGVTSVASGQGSNGLGFDFSNASSTGSAIGVGLSTNGAPYRGGSMLLLDGANVIDPGCNCWSTAVVNPEFTQEVKVATSNFNADQPNGPVVFDLNYTWSKSLGIVNSTVDAFTVHGNYGVLNIDRPHVINTSYSYDFGKPYHGSTALRGVVNGWTISGTTTWQAGANLQANYSSQNLGLSLQDAAGNSISTRTFYGTNVGLILPTFTCNPGSSLGSHEQINVSCLTAPAIGDYGQRVVPASGPAYFNQDLAVHKSLAITERQKVEFRLSAFNLFNHPLWAMNWGNMGTLPLKLSGSSWALNNVNSDYGQITTKTEYRRIQLGLKYTF